ncbi:MAG: questin oxidase family protein, partial [Angustibacter sp.]
MDPAANLSQLDEAFARFHETGPEFQGWLSNHGPMASDALLRIGGGDRLGHWAHCYAGRLEELPRPRWVIRPEDWREAWGDPTRLGDWLRYFERALAERPWADVLAEFWPRLVSGAAASATHGLIRTGHAVRALAQETSPVRLAELAQALGYWAARWQPLTFAPTPAPNGQPDPERVQALLSEAATLLAHPEGGFRPRLRELQARPGWVSVSTGLGQIPQDVPAALTALATTGSAHYAHWGAGDPVMLVHIITAPRAAGWVLPHLPTGLWDETWVHVSQATAALTALYPARAWTSAELSRTAEPLAVAAVQHGDEHVVKLAEAIADPE